MPLTEPLTDTLKHVEVFTDGGCAGNPGPGGYGIILKHGEKTREISGGYRLTTNNRMELMAAIVALESLKYPCKVTIYSDSQYVGNGITKGWAKKWRSNGWMRTPKDAAINPDLWGKLLDLCDKHKVEFIWVRGHAGHPENERCDRLAVAALAENDLPTDEEYERVNSRAGR